ncbi:Trihelix transcription factor [Nymphaea thermarum]|nr:Trihelix transcription factor [Nymphaea thermarum]
MDASPLNSKGTYEDDNQTAANVLGITDMTPWDGATGCNFSAEQKQDVGRVILVKWGDVTRKIGIDGSSAAIKEAIRNAFRLRSKRSFWLEDGDGVVRSLDRAMPLTTYTLHVDLGVTIKIYQYDECNQHVVSSEDATLYTEEDFRELLSRLGWRALREVGTYKDVESIAELRENVAYHHSGFKT